MKATIIASLAIVLIASSAIAGGRPTDSASSPTPPVRVATACTFEAPQVSGYRGRASERRISYYDCAGTTTSIVIDAANSCQQERTVMIDLEPAVTLLSRPCQGDRSCNTTQ